MNIMMKNIIINSIIDSFILCKEKKYKKNKLFLILIFHTCMSQRLFLKIQ